MNGNVIHFQRKSKMNNEKEDINEQILTLHNLYQSYRNNLQQLNELKNTEFSEDIELLKNNLKVIEEQIGKLTGLLK